MNNWFVSKDKKVSGSWSYDLDYFDTYNQLVNQIKGLRKDFKLGKITNRNKKRYAYYINGLIQLRNGSRVGEAWEALKNFCKSPDLRVTQVRVQKRKDDYLRKMVLPDDITKSDLEFIKDIVFDDFNNRKHKALISAISQFFKVNHGFSTHSLRYAMITYLAINEKVQASVIAKITGHKTMNLIVHYIEKKFAENALFNLGRNMFKPKVSLRI